MRRSIIFLGLAAYMGVLFQCHTKEHRFLKLWYRQPATQWTEALPVGNGRLGAMVFGQPDTAVIQWNDESLWAGMPMDNNNPKALKSLPEIRRLLFEGKNGQAALLAQKTFLGTPPRIRSYQTLGELAIAFKDGGGKISNYKRSLDLDTGIVTVSYTLNGQNYLQEAFASAPDNVIAIRLETDDPAGLNGNIFLKRKQDASVQATSAHSLEMTGQIIDPPDSLSGPGGKHMRFNGLLEVRNDGGTMTAKEDHLEMSGAQSATLVLTAATDYNLEKLDFDPAIDPAGQCADIINALKTRKYAAIKKDQIEDHERLFDRVDLNLVKMEADTVPTDKRLEMVKAGGEDLHLTELYFQYGRYLLMGSSRKPGVLPANLQGVWNKDFNAPWHSDFHTNINLQMNYWPAEVCNLSETVLPLVNFMDKIRKPGHRTAREMYGDDGWTMHHLTDPFGRTGVMDGVQWGTFPMGGPWMCFPIWRHFEYTQDTSYLKNKAWPILKGSAEFVLGFLTVGPDGYLVTAPSNSPENSFYMPGTKTPMRFTYAATMDVEIINELFKYCLKAAAIVGNEQDLVQKIEAAQKKLPPIRIGANGTIREWIKDYEEVEPGHRHMSHLLALHPGSQITPQTPALFEAAKKTIARRLANGGGHTGWSRAWIINFYARLLDGEKAHEHLQALLSRSTLSNLFDTHPPFQIDGNFGGTSGIAEMLLQSQNDLIRILPALPQAWPSGHITGLKARGNFEVDIYWKNHKLQKLQIKSLSGLPCHLKYGDHTQQFDTKAGEVYKFDASLNAQ